MVPLLAGLAELGFWTVHGHPASGSGQVQAFVSSFALILLGLFIAGPWLTMAAARAMARWTSRPGTLIAARRIADDPRAAFRAVSGLVLALFVTTVAVVAITTQNAKEPTRFGTVAEDNMLTDQLAVSSPGSSVLTGAGPAAPAAPLAARLRAIPGVQGVVVIRMDPGLTIPGRFDDIGSDGNGKFSPVPASVVSCAQLATVPALGRCPAGATTAAYPAGGFSANGLGGNIGATGITWPAANVPVARLDTLAVDSVNVGTDGSVAAIEQARTVLETAHAYPVLSAPSTLGDIVKQDNSTNSGYQQLANVVILVSLPIAGCTLAAGIAAGLADRKRPFSLLRLTGARLGTLRRVVALEGAVPLLSVSAVAIGAGFAGAAMFATEAQQHPMVAPGAGVLPAHRGRDHRLPRHHRGHLPAADPDHRAGGRAERLAEPLDRGLRPLPYSGCRAVRTRRSPDETAEAPRVRCPDAASQSRCPQALSRQARPRRRWELWRSPAGQPGWARPALLAVAALAALLYTRNIGSADLAPYYSVAVKSMSESWKAFCYGAFDPAATITIDKLAGAFVPQALSARIFGFHPWSLALPQVIEGVVTVLVMYRAVRQWAGEVPGLLAALLLTLTPIVASVFGHPMEDGALTLCLVLAADAWQRAVVTGRLRPLVAVRGVGRAWLPGQDAASLDDPARAVHRLPRCGAAAASPGMPGR